ncbi:MAG: hypothetical protein ACRCXY_11485 [Fusobacteriaceae bacterium]
MYENDVEVVRYAIVPRDKFEDETLPSVGLDNLSDLSKEAKLLSTEDRNGQAIKLFKLFKDEKLFFTSFEDRIEFIMYLPRIHLREQD